MIATAISLLTFVTFALKRAVLETPEVLEVLGVGLNYPQKPLGLADLFALALKLLLVNLALLRPSLLELR